METEQAYTVDVRGNVAQFYEVESGDIVATINREDDVDGVPDQSTWDGGEHVTAWAIANGYPEVATMTELFQIEPVLSPRLKWMREHGITLDDPRPLSSEPFRAYTIFNVMLPTEINSEILAGNRGITFQDAYGNTEDEALCKLALELGIFLWNEQSPASPSENRDQ